MRGADALIAARLAAGDDHALAEVFDRLGPAVYGAALSVVGDGDSAQDIVQDVFVELWMRPDRYDPAAGSLRTYLMVVARHRAVDVVRSELRRIARQRRHHLLADEHRLQSCGYPGSSGSLGVLGSLGSPGSPGDGVVAAEMIRAVRAAVNLLPEAQRRVIELAYFEGLTCREVALAAGIPEGTAKSRLRLALAKLETTLDRQLLETS